MNWSAMNKSQRELFVLKALAVFAAVVAVFYYGALPLVDRGLQLRRTRRDLEEQIVEAENGLRREPALRAEFARRRDDLRVRVRQQLPPAANPLLWAGEFIHRHARAAGVAIERVEEVKGEIPAWARPPERPAAEDGTARAERPAPSRQFVPFAVQVTAVSGYDRLRAFVRSMEEANPLASVISISVVARAATPEQHQVRLVVEWPRPLESLQANLTAIVESE